MKVSLLLLILTVSGCGSTRIVAEAGQNVTLSCTYDVGYHGPLSVCWNRGEIPSLGCDNTLVSSDGVAERSRVSGRFRLLGQLSRGDVSLTILNVTEDGAGRYGCRVKIPGLFNDEKHHYDLSVVPRRTVSPSQPSPSSPSSPSSSSWRTTTNETAGHTASRDTPLTKSSNGESSVQGGGGLTAVLVGVLFGLVFLVTASGLLIVGRRWRQLNKPPLPQTGGSVGFSSTSSTLHLHCRNATVENIYQIEENEYECPEL